MLANWTDSLHNQTSTCMCTPRLYWNIIRISHTKAAARPHRGCIRAGGHRARHEARWHPTRRWGSQFGDHVQGRSRKPRRPLKTAPKKRLACYWNSCHIALKYSAMATALMTDRPRPDSNRVSPGSMQSNMWRCFQVTRMTPL